MNKLLLLLLLTVGLWGCHYRKYHRPHSFPPEYALLKKPRYTPEVESVPGADNEVSAAPATDVSSEAVPKSSGKPASPPPKAEVTRAAAAVSAAGADISRKYQYKVRGKNYKVFNSGKRFQQTGMASWYGAKFHGRKTASGERYNMHAMTAAHKTLPIGTKVKVTNLRNSKQVVVRINDRGPFHSGRIIDVSKKAATKLGMIGSGHARVHIKAID